MKNVGPLPNEVGAVLTEDAKKAEILNAFFASVFAIMTSLWESWNLQVRERVWGMEDFPLVKHNMIRDQLAKINGHKSTGPGGMVRKHTLILKTVSFLRKSFSIWM